MSKYEYYKKMRLIRSFEEMLLDLFSKNEISGTTHTCIGQETVAVAAMDNLLSEDIVFSNHRCHGHFLAYGGPVEELLAEIMSREGGVCGGRGGSQHLHFKHFFSNGIQGGIVPNATGMAWAEKIKGTDNIAMVFLGDGTLGQGIVYESMNMASLYSIPVLYVIENNQYAMTTKVVEGVSGDIIRRPEAFGIRTYHSGSVDIEVLSALFKEAQQYVRNKKAPACIVVETYRLAAHSKGDDTREPEEIEKYKQKDPLRLLRNQLLPERVESLEREIQLYLCDVLKRVKELPMADLPKLDKSEYRKISNDKIVNQKEQKNLEQINEALRDVMAEDNNVLLLGEDIRDSYGGAFKVTKGLSTLYGERVVNTPISEAGFTGLAVGLAMSGMRPVVEMMFGDFVTLAFDQILNHATKYRWVYGENVHVPLIMRTPMGGGRGYGPTHSQSLEKHFLGIPGLRLVAGSPVHNNYELYKHIITTADTPTQIIESKRMYAEPMLVSKEKHIGKFVSKVIYEENYPTIYLTLDETTNPDVIILTYGYMTKEVMKAAVDMMIEDEIQVDIAVVSQVYPLPMNDLDRILSNGNRILTVEEGTLDAGWGSEVVAMLVERFSTLHFKRVAADNEPIANGKKLEEKQSVSYLKIKDAVRGLYYEN